MRRTLAQIAGIPAHQRYVAQIPTGGLKAPAPDGSQDSWSNTEAGRNVTNSLAALPAAGTMLRSGRMVGSAVQSATAAGEVGAINAGGAALRAMTLPAAGAATLAGTSDAGQPPPTARERLLAAGGAGAGRGSVNPPMVDPSKPLSQLEPSSAPQPGYGPIGDRTTLTNEQAATMNPAGRITATRQPDGTMSFSGNDVSGQVSYNDASGKALPGGGINGKGFSGFDVAPAGANVVLGPSGSYAFASDGVQQPSSVARGFAPTGGGPSSVGPSSGMSSALDAARQAAMARGDLDAVAASYGAPVRPGPSLLLPGGSFGFRRDRNIVADEQGAQSRFAYAQGTDPASRKRAAQLQQIAAQQQGETARARLLEAGRGARFGQEHGLARDKFGLEQTAAGYQNRSAQRMEKAQIDLEEAKTPVAQRSALERLMALVGKTPQNEWGVQVTPTTKNADGSSTQGSVWRYNKTTGETARVDEGQGNPAPPPSKESLVRGKVYQTKAGAMRWNGSGFERVG